MTNANFLPKKAILSVLLSNLETFESSIFNPVVVKHFIETTGCQKYMEKSEEISFQIELLSSLVQQYLY